VFCVLAERFGWTFDVIGDMTMDQLEAALAYCGKHPPVRLF